MDAWINGLMNKYTNRWMSEQKTSAGAWVDKWITRLTEIQMDGEWIDRQIKLGG